MHCSIQPSYAYLLNCTIQGDIPVLLVHVVVASSGLISHPHTKILDLGWVLLSNLQHTSSLLRRFLCKIHSVQMDAVLTDATAPMQWPVETCLLRCSVHDLRLHVMHGLYQAFLIIAAVLCLPHADAAVALTSLTANTWPFAFLTLRSFLRKYLHRHNTTLGLLCSVYDAKGAVSDINQAGKTCDSCA